MCGEENIQNIRRDSIALIFVEDLGWVLCVYTRINVHDLYAALKAWGERR